MFLDTLLTEFHCQVLSVVDAHAGPRSNSCIYREYMSIYLPVTVKQHETQQFSYPLEYHSSISPLLRSVNLQSAIEVDTVRLRELQVRPRVHVQR